MQCIRENIPKGIILIATQKKGGKFRRHGWHTRSGDLMIPWQSSNSWFIQQLPQDTISWLLWETRRERVRLVSPYNAAELIFLYVSGKLFPEKKRYKRYLDRDAVPNDWVGREEGRKDSQPRSVASDEPNVAPQSLFVTKKGGVKKHSATRHG